MRDDGDLGHYVRVGVEGRINGHIQRKQLSFDEAQRTQSLLVQRRRHKEWFKRQLLNHSLF